MKGPLVGIQDRLYYEFDLGAMVPADHLLRRWSDPEAAMPKHR